MSLITVQLVTCCSIIIAFCEYKMGEEKKTHEHVSVTLANKSSEKGLQARHKLCKERLPLSRVEWLIGEGEKQKAQLNGEER